MQINSITNIPKIEGLATTQKATKTGGTSFSDVINDAINKVNDLQVESSNLTDSFLSGETDNIHSVIIAGSKADLALQMTLQVRNKVMDAYNEIMRMNI